MPTTTNQKRVDVAELLRWEAERLRILDLKAITRAGSGHPGGTLSLAEVMSTLFFGGVLRYDPQDPTWQNRDRLVLSEGHTAPILYTAFVEAGFKGWSLDALMDLRKNPDVIAQGHTTRLLTPGVDCSTGALGMGGSKSLGMALAARYKGLDYHTFCIIGDGEGEEGQVYEAASNAALVGADNLTWILNRNKAQQTAGTQDVSSIHYDELFKALGWNVVVLAGESAAPDKNRDFITKLRAALLEAKRGAHNAGRPTVIIADTIKGKGVDFMEYRNQKPGEYKFHGVAPTEEQLAQALPLIEARLGSPDLESLTAFLREGAISSAAKGQVDELNIQRAKERRQKQMEIRQSAQVSFPAYKPTDKPVGTRVGFGNALAYLASKYPEIVATSPDLQDSVHMFDMEKVTRRHGKTNPLGAYFPEGIAESTACGKCAGLGYEGLIPFIGTFDNFLLEAADELQHAAAFGSFYIAVGTHSGCGVGPDGKSQMGVAMPGVIDDFSGPDGDLFEMYEPADAQEAAEVTRLVVERVIKNGAPRHPVYIRCTRHNIAHLDRSGIRDYLTQLESGSYVIAGSGPADLLIIASGATVAEAVKAGKELVAQGIRVKIVNVVSLNKIQKADSAFVREQLDEETPILTVHDAEAHALGHRVAEAINTARRLGRKPGILLKSLGVNVSPLSNHVGSGTSEENYRRNQLDAAGITAVVRQLLKK
jgi:transketolase